MIKTLNFTDISQEKFNLIMNGMLEIIGDKSKIESFSKLRSIDEAFEFLQVFCPGNYDENDFAKFLMIVLANFYYNSKEFARHELFELTLEDIKKRTGTDFKKYLQNFHNSRNKKINDSNFNVSGGFGDKKLSKIIAGSLAALVPFSTAANNSSTNAMFNYGKRQSTKSAKSSGGIWQWMKKNWKPIAIVGGVVTTGIGAFCTYKRMQSSQKFLDAAEKLNENDNREEKLSTSFWDYFIPGSSARDKVTEETAKEKNHTELCKKIEEGISIIDDKIFNKDKTNKDTKLGDSGAGEKVIKIINKYISNGNAKKNTTVEEAKKLLKEYNKKKEYNITSKERKEAFEEITKDSDKVGLKESLPKLAMVGAGVSACWNFLKSGFDAIANLSKKTSDIADMPKKILETQEKLKKFLEPKDNYTSYYENENELLMSKNIKQGLNSIIKGQKAQMDQLAKILAAFNVQARMAAWGQDDGANDGVTSSSQLNSRCVFLTGPSGTGKSMLTGLVRRFITDDVRYLTINLNQYDGKTDVNTYLSKQQEFINSSYYLDGRYVVITIEEIDKICSKDPVIEKNVNQWLHSVYDTGKIGGGEKSEPITVAAALFLMTSNELPSVGILKNGKVDGLNIKSGNKIITSSNKNNYIDILRELSKNASREMPIERTGALESRSEFIEFNQTSDEAMREIVDMHLQEINDKFLIRGIPVKINYDEVFVEKIAKLRHAKMYKDGGSRTIMNDILKPIYADITDKMGGIEGKIDDSVIYDKEGNVIEENLTQVWLDYGGVNDSGKLIINMKENEADVTNNGKDPDMCEEEFNTNRKPELEKFIQKLMNGELNDIVGNLSTAYNSGVVKDWNSILNPASKTIIKQLSSLVSSSGENNNINDQIKTLVEKRDNLIDLMNKRGILDDEWESLKELRNIVKSKTADAVAIKKNQDKSKISLKSLQENLDSIEKIKSLAVSVKKYNLFSVNNKNSLGKIFEMLSKNGNRQFGSESNMTFEGKLDELIKNKNIINSINLDLTEEQHNAIENFGNSVQKQIEIIKSEVNQRANNIEEILNDISKFKNNSNLKNYKLFLNQSDSEFLKSLIRTVNPDYSVNDIDEQLNFVLANKSQIKEKLFQMGVTDEQLKSAKSLEIKIQNNLNINEKKIDEAAAPIPQIKKSEENKPDFNNLEEIIQNKEANKQLIEQKNLDNQKQDLKINDNMHKEKDENNYNEENEEDEEYIPEGDIRDNKKQDLKINDNKHEYKKDYNYNKDKNNFLEKKEKIRQNIEGIDTDIEDNNEIEVEN